MKVVIIEGEEIVARHLEAAIGRFRKDFKQVDTLPDFFEFISYLKKNDEPDLLLLDIFQIDHEALRFFQSGTFAFPLLFTNSLKAGTSLTMGSAGESGALSNASNNLSVKLKKTRILKAVLENSINHMDATVFSKAPVYLPQDYQQRFLVKNKQKLLSIKLEEVALFYAEGRINFIKTKDNRKFFIQYTMETLSHSLLDPKHFFRVNRSTIVSFDDIKEMFSYFGGRVKLVLNTPHEKEIIVSRDKVSEFKKWLGE